MLGDIGRIPIISLSGCISLSDILSELPLPQPLPKSVSGVELIDDLRLQHEAQIHLRSRDDWLIESISTALCATSTSGIILKNDLKTTPVDFHTLPPLLKESISRKPNILEENLSFQCIYSSKEVLQILSGEAGKCPSKIASPPKTHLATASHQNAVPLNAAPPKVISKPPQPTSPSNGGVYSVTSVEPLKLSIKRAPPTPAAPLSTPSHDGGKKTRCKRRSKGSTPSSSINQSWAVERGKMAEAAVPSVSSQTQPVRSPCVHQPVVPAPRLPPLTTSPRLQPILHPPPPLPPPAPKDPLCRSTNQMLNTMLTQLLQSDHESTIASLLSSSDGQSLGTPASVEPHHPRSPPLSVPSNCSYPATPCVNTNASVHNGNGNNNNLTTTDPSPINAIFDAADVGDVREAISAPVPPPPRGLAAYLQKTHNPEVVASPSEESVDAYARQHGSVPPMSTSPWAERRSGQQVAPSTVTAGNGGGAAYPTSSSLTNTPNGLERGGGKEKRGRRRRSELEELINWRVRDQPASSSGLFKKHQPPAQQALPILENSPLVSDNEGAAFFTEPLGERVKRRRQQHKTTPSFSNGGEVARTGGRGGGKSGGKKRHRDDTSSEISASPKRNSASGRHQHHGLTSSESDLPEDDDEEEEEEEEQKGKDDAGGASSSSCLTDSPVPRKQSLQRLVEEVKGRPPSLSKLEKLRHSEDTTSATSMPVSTEEVSPLLSAVTSNSRPLSSTERPRREASTRSSTSPPPLLALQACAPDPLSHAGRRQVKKHRQPTQSLSPLSSNEEEDGPVKKLPLSPVSTIPDRHSTKMKSDPHRRGDTSGTSARAPVKKSRSMVDKTHRVRAYLSSSSDSDKGSSVSFVKRRHNKPKPPPSEANLDSSPDSSASSNVGRVRTTRKNTPSTQPCTSSSAMDDDDENDELSALKAATRLPSPPPSVATTDLSDFDRTEEVLEAEKRKAEEVTKFAAAFTHFTAHITDLLRRVGGLDLLKIAGEMSSVPVDPGEDGEEFPDQTPVEARLSRRELNTLYQEADDVRVAGSMSNEPNGRLVRLLNLLLVNIRDAACLAAPNPTNSNFKELIQRRKARIQRRHGGVESASAGGSSECLSESLLWSHPAWLRVLRGLDAALIALHIVAGPDVPRARLLAMEDLVEAITAITHFHFNRLVTAIHAPADSKRSGSDISAGLTNLVRDSVGSRLSEALCGLVSLVRLHPGRFTDSLIMRLVDLALLVLSSALTFTGTRKSPTSSSSSSTTTPTTAAIVLFPDPAPPFIAGEGLEERQRRQTDYYTRNTWRLQMQRAALSLTATIFSQYDKHRQLIAAEVFSTMVPTPSKAYRPGQSTPTGAAKSLATVRNFWILASGSFTKGWKPFQIPTRNVTPAVPLSTPTSAFPLVANACFLLVHPFTALLLALIQSLIPAPSHLIGGRRSSSAGAPATPSSGVSQQSTTTGTGLSDQHGVNDSIQLAKEEKATTSAYFNATRTSMYLISELVKKAATKGEDDLRPLVDTVLVDLLRVAADSPIEWPVANFLLNAFGKVLTQILNGSTASVSSSSSTSRSRSPTQTSGSNASVRNPDVAMRLVAADNLITLAGGLRLMGKLRGSVEESSAPTDFDLAEAESALSAFLATPVLGLCHLTLGYDCESEAGERAVAERLASYTEQRDFAYQLISRLRYQHFDGLTLTSRRFHVIGCLYEVAQELAGDTSSDRRKHLEEARRSLLTEFAATHHSLSGMAPWLPPRRGTTTAGFGGGGSGGGRAGLISPTSSEPGFGEGPGGDVVLALYTGHGLGADGRRRKIAHAHRLATKLAAHFTNSPGFDFLFMHIVKLFYDPSIPLRARALKCLSSLLDIAPGCIPPPPLPSPLSTSVAVAKYGGPSDILSIIPVRLMDSSPAVREAAVELVGRLVTTPNSSSFLGPLYNPLVDRVLDLCVSVRKRAVKSLQTLLLCDSDGAKRASGLSTKQRSDSCIILLRRLNDEESVKKLVMETFLALWFTPLLSSGDDASKADARLRERVACVCEVVASFRNRGLQTVEEFMTAILNQESSEKSAQVDTACSEIVDFLIKIVHQCQANDWHEDAFKPTPNPPGASQHAKTCPLHPKHSRGRSDARCTCSSDSITTTGALSVLHLVAKCRPQLLLRHVPLLTRVIAFAAAVQDTGSGPESSALYFTTGIIEACCLHLASAGESQLSQLFPDGSDAFEDALIVLLQRHCRVVVDASLSCLSTIVNRLTKNYSRVTTCFAQFF
uniref:Nipped-B protein n=2 Tax=Mesocestoides corti TaxID=53468 RepID=A0A5K3FIG4_MESCO